MIIHENELTLIKESMNKEENIKQENKEMKRFQ